MVSGRMIAIAAVVAITTLGTLSGAAATPAARTSSSGHSTGIRPIRGGSDAGALVDGRATVRKARTTVTLPLTLLRTYANETSHITNNILISQSPIWAVTHIGPHPRFGVFPVAHSTVLGFGAIPITADLHLTQLVRHGQIVPITLFSRAGTQFPFVSYPTHVRGDVNVRVSNVYVDRVPLHVGPNCHTVTPMHLSLTGTDPSYGLFTGGLLHGTVTIPPFTGCGVAGDNLDPLLTGTISGPGNKIVQHQGNLAPWTPKDPSDCSACRPPKG